jgi:hypothetical protein
MEASVTERAGRIDWAPLWLAMGFAVLLVGLDVVLRPEGARLTREGGGIETASALLYVYAVAVWLRRHSTADWRAFWHIPVILLFAAAREFDLDKTLTSVGILKSNLYLTDQAPVWERLVGLAVLLLLMVAAVQLVRVHGRGFLRGLRAGDSGALAVAAAIGVAGFAKSIDGLARKLRPFDITVDDEFNAVVVMAEEVLELTIPLLLLYAILEATRGPARR